MSLFDSASLVVTPNGYKEDKLYSIKPTDGSGDLVVTRATTATRVNSAGLIEPVAYNLLTYSQEFDNAAWGKSGVSVTANQTTAPDGNNTADLVTTTNATSHELLQSKVATGVHTCSFYVKKNNSQTFYINMYPNGWTAYFNLNNGTVSSVVGSGVSANVTNAGNGWYRCSMTFTSVGSEIQLGFLDTVYTGVAGNPWTISTSVGTSGYVWGAQLVSGTSAKEYFPTTDRLDVPRLDYTNSSCPSILVEPQRTNLVTYSEQFDNAVWQGFNTPTIVANTVISPDGTQNADTITFSVNGSSLVYQNYAGLSNTYTISVYAKSSTNKKFCFRNFGGSGVIRSADFTTTNQWQKFTYTFTDTLINVSICNESAGGVGSIDVWGAQLEAGSYATSYIPTIASSVTRNADVISKTGISSLIGQTEGTLFYDGYFGNEIFEIYLFLQKEISTGVNDSIFIRKNGSQISLSVYSGSTQQVFISNGTFTIGQRIKIAAAYKNNDFVLYVNGVQIGADNSGSVPTCGALQFQSYRAEPTNSDFIANKGCKTSAIFKTRLSNTELASFTTI